MSKNKIELSIIYTCSKTDSKNCKYYADRGDDTHYCKYMDARYSIPICRNNLARAEKLKEELAKVSKSRRGK